VSTAERERRGEPDVYEIVWMSGHVETVLAHQVSYPGGLPAFLGAPEGKPRIRMHAEIDGRWKPTLDALEEDIRTIRLVTDAEPLPGGAS